jgi:hypothetical protein
MLFLSLGNKRRERERESSEREGKTNTSKKDSLVSEFK